MTKAYAITWNGMTGVYIAQNAGKAKYLAALAITDCWNRTVGQAFLEMKCRRAPEYDVLEPAGGRREGHVSTYDVDTHKSKLGIGDEIQRRSGTHCY